MNKKLLFKVVFSGIAAILLSGHATAALITFTWSGTGSGAIGSTSFTNSDFVITAVGDTTNLSSFSFGTSIDHDTASIDISSLGTFTFITGTTTFVNNSKGIVGFSQTLAGDLINGPTDTAFTTWGMNTAIGPITGSGELLQWNDPFQPEVNTTGGVLFFNDASTPLTFQASVVPVPAAIWLFGSGLLGLAGITRRSNK